MFSRNETGNQQEMEMNGITAEELLFWEPGVCVCYHYYYITSHKVRLGLWKWLDCWVGQVSGVVPFPPSSTSFYTPDDGQASGHVNLNSHVSSTSSCHNEHALEQLSVSGTKCTQCTSADAGEQQTTNLLPTVPQHAPPRVTSFGGKEVQPQNS